MDLTVLLLISIFLILISLKISKYGIEYIIWYNKVSKIPKFPMIKWALGVQLRKIEAKEFEDGIFSTWLGRTTIHTNRLEYAEIILRDTKQITKSNLYKYFEPWFGFGLVNSSGKRWAHDRKFITPAFHFGILEEFAEVMVEKAAILNKKLEDKIKSNGSDYFDTFEIIGNCALDIIYETALGMNIHAQDGIESDYIQATRTLTDEVTSRIFRPWLKFDFIYYRTARGKIFKKAVDIAHDRCSRVIESKKKERERKSEMNNLNSDTTDDIAGKKKEELF